MENITNDDILAQLNRILSSRKLSSSTVLTEFLNFVVRESLEGRGSILKEYTIGVHALKKDSDFNPQLDSIVRIHAGRLRRALKEYYWEEGANDSLLISIPTGSYAPTYAVREILTSDTEIQTLETGLPSDNGLRHEHHLYTVRTLPAALRFQTFTARPSISVVPFKKIGDGKLSDNIARGLAELISTELTQFETLKVVSYYSGDHINPQPSDIRELGTLLRADYILTGSVQVYSQHITISVQLNNSRDGSQLWACRFEKKNAEKSYWIFQERVIDTVLASVAGLNGAVLRNELSERALLTHNGIAWWYLQYIQNFDLKTIQNAKHFYQNVIDADPDNAIARAFLSEIYAGESLLLDSSELLQIGSSHARKAIKINPFCQHAYRALAINTMMQRRIEFVSILEQGLKINPKSSDYLGAMGALLIFAGEFDRGARILDKVIELNPLLPWWQRLSYSMYAYHTKSYVQALYWTSMAEVDILAIRILKAASYAQLNLLGEAGSIVTEIRREYAKADVHSLEFLQTIYLAHEFIEEIKHGLDRLQLA